MKCTISNISAIKEQAEEIKNVINDSSYLKSRETLFARGVLVLMCANAITLVCDDIIERNKNVCEVEE